MRIRAIIFDFDGLVLDTELPEYQTWSELFAEHGCKMSMQVWAEFLGRPHEHFDPYLHLEQLSGRKLDRESIRKRKRARIRELLLPKPEMAGVRQYIVQAKMMEMKLAVASSSSREWVTGHLERLGLLHHFDAILCKEDTTEHKPNPAPYRAAMAAVGVSPEEAIALEDSPNGVKAAKAAGMFCVAVANELTRQLDLSAADLKVNSLEELPLQELLQAASFRKAS